MKTSKTYFLLLFILLIPSISLMSAEGTEYAIASKFKAKFGIDKLFVSVDNNENILVTGFFSDSITIEDERFVSQGILDIFIAKYDADYNLIWLKHAGGANIDFSKFINTDMDDNIYIQGMYKGNAHFEGYYLDSKGTYDYFTAKYTNTGELLWVKTRKGSSIVKTPFADNRKGLRRN